MGSVRGGALAAGRESEFGVGSQNLGKLGESGEKKVNRGDLPLLSPSAIHTSSLESDTFTIKWDGRTEGAQSYSLV